jgi:hypothetical protein
MPGDEAGTLLSLTQNSTVVSLHYVAKVHQDTFTKMFNAVLRWQKITNSSNVISG